MKPSSLKSFTFVNHAKLIFSILCISSISLIVEASIIAGDVIGINAHRNAITGATDWNNFSNTGSIAAGSVVNLLDGTTFTNVTIDYANTVAGGFNGDGSAAPWSETGGNGANDPFVGEDGAGLSAADLDALNDINFTNGGITVTVGGLDPTLLYDVRIYSNISSASTASDSFSVNGGTLITNTRGDRFSSSDPVIFSSQSVNGSNELVIEATDDVGNTFINAIVVQAIPEPSSILLVSGLSLLAFFARGRRKR